MAVPFDVFFGLFIFEKRSNFYYYSALEKKPPFVHG